jgi:hypothetical protein
MNFSLDCLNSFWDRNIEVGLVSECVLAVKRFCGLNDPGSFDKDLQVTYYFDVLANKYRDDLNTDIKYQLKEF